MEPFVLVRMTEAEASCCSSLRRERLLYQIPGRGNNVGSETQASDSWGLRRPLTIRQRDTQPLNVSRRPTSPGVSTLPPL